MANFFSADYWKALYFKAMGGQETAVDPNALRGTFAGSSSFTGTLDQPAGSQRSQFWRKLWSLGDYVRSESDPRRKKTVVGELSGSFYGDSTFTGTLEAASPSLEARLEKLERDEGIRAQKREHAEAVAAMNAAIAADADDEEEALIILMLAA